MDCGITFSLNKWALTSGLGLFSVGSYETYQIIKAPISSAPGNFNSIELTSWKPVQNEIQNQEEIEEIATAINLVEEIVPTTISEPISEPISEIKIEEEDEEEVAEIFAEPEITIEEKQLPEETPVIKEEVKEEVKEEPAPVSLPAPKPQFPTCIFTFRNPRAAWLLQNYKRTMNRTSRLCHQ